MFFGERNEVAKNKKARPNYFLDDKLQFVWDGYFFNFVRTNHLKLIFMGKGDKKTRKGKITQGSYGKTRPKKSSKSVIPAKVEKPKKEVAPKAEKPKKTEKSTEEVVEEKPKTTRKKKTEE